MTSPQFIQHIEAKFAKHKVERLVPDEETLREAYLRARQIALANEAMQQVLRDARAEAKRLDLPTGLADLVAAGMRRDVTAPWHTVIAGMALSAGTN
jgi:hypothetical protein